MLFFNIFMEAHFHRTVNRLTDGNHVYFRRPMKKKREKQKESNSEKEKGKDRGTERERKSGKREGV